MLVSRAPLARSAMDLDEGGTLIVERRWESCDSRDSKWVSEYSRHGGESTEAQ